MREVSLGGAVALMALAPIAVRLADEHEHREAERERERRMAEALATAPPIERPSEPNRTPGISLREQFGAMVGWTCGLFLPMFWAVNAIPAFIHHHESVGYANPVQALVFSAMLGVVLGGWRYWRALYRLDRERRRYEGRLRAAKAREVEREAIMIRFGGGER